MVFAIHTESHQHIAQELAVVVEALHSLIEVIVHGFASCPFCEALIDLPVHHQRP